MNFKKNNWNTIINYIGINVASTVLATLPANALLYNRFEFVDIYGNVDINGGIDWDASINGTAPGQTITGTIGFDQNFLDSSLSGNNIPAESFVIDSVPSYFQDIWQDTNFGIEKNIVGAGNTASDDYSRTYEYFSGVMTGNSYNPRNSFNITNGLITDFSFEERFYLNLQEPNNENNEQYEWIVLGGAENENSLLDPAYTSFNGIFPGNFLEITYLLDFPLLISEPITYSDVYVYDFDNNITFTSVSESSPALGLLTIGGIWVMCCFYTRIINYRKAK